jgi:hypothetical protein
MKEFTIVIDGAGFYEVYVVKAKDLKTAKAKAKKMAIRDFSRSLKAFKEVS